MPEDDIAVPESYQLSTLAIIQPGLRNLVRFVVCARGRRGAAFGWLARSVEGRSWMEAWTELASRDGVERSLKRHRWNFLTPRVRSGLLLQLTVRLSGAWNHLDTDRNRQLWAVITTAAYDA